MIADSGDHASILDGCLLSGAKMRPFRHNRLDLLEKNRLIHVSPKHLKWADDWFERYGDATVFFSRMLPIVRTFISLPAGIAKMPFWRFTVLTLLGCIPWVLMLALIGRSVGDNWEEWRDHLHYLDYAVVAVAVIGVAYWLIKRRRGGGSGDESAEAALETAGPDSA